MNNPFLGSGSIYKGGVNPTHTSDAAIVYKEGELSTPWPFLAASYGISLLLGLIGLAMLAKSRKKQRGLVYGEVPTNQYYEEGKPKPAANVKLLCATIGYHTLRTFFLLGASISHALGHHTPTAPSAAILMLCSVAPFFSNRSTPRIFIVWIAVDTLIIYLSLVLLTRGPHSADAYYSTLERIGGNCAFVFDDFKCVDNAALWDYAGCPPYDFPDAGTNQQGIYSTVPGWDPMRQLSAMADSDDINTNGNTARNVEKYIGIVGVYGGAIVAGIALVSILMSEIWRRELWMQPLSRVRLAKVFPKVDNTFDGLASGAFTATFLVALLALSFNYVQHNNEFTVTVIDSFGSPGSFPHVGTFSGGNSTRWSDCFEIPFPDDKWGFIAFWWNEQLNSVGAKAVRILGAF